MKTFKRNQLEVYDNQLDKIMQEKTILRKRLEDLDESEKMVLDNRRNAGIKIYMNPVKRKKLIDDAEQLGYSPITISMVKEYSDEWNQDKVTNDIIDEFEDMKKYVKRQAPYKNNILYKIANAFDIGGGENED